MDLNKLEYFLCVCKHLKFTPAADELFITQQGLSMAIHRLEKELGTKLFIHTPKGLLLTESGFYFKDTAANIINEFRNYKHRTTIRETVNVACMTHAFTKLPLPVQRLLFNLDPAFKVSLFESTCAECETRLLRNEADFAISIPHHAHHILETDKLYTAEIIAVVNKNSPLAKEPFFRLEFLKKVPFLMPGSHSKTCQLVTEQLQMKKIPVSRAFDCSFPFSILSIVNFFEEFVGILADYILTTANMQNIVAKKFDPDCMRYDICLVKNSSKMRSEQVRYFEDYFLDLMKDR